MGNNRITALDGLRGLAAMTVVVHHSLLVAQPFEDVLVRQTAVSEPWLAALAYSPLHLLWAGSEAVVLFFVLSGFVLALPFFERDVSHGYPAFVVRRVCRIYLPYVVVVLVAVAALSAFSRFGEPRLSSWFNRQWFRPIDGGDLFGWLAMTGDQTMLLNSPIWSLVHEMRVSLIFPALALLVKRTSWIPAAIIALWLMFVPSDAGLSLLQTVHYSGLFVFGALLAKHQETLRRRLQALGTARTAVLFAGAIALYLHVWLFGLGAPMLSDDLVGLGAALLLLLALDRGHLLLTSGPCRWLGRISYSLYLSHTLVLLSLVYTLGQVLPVWIAVALTLPTALLVAMVLERWVERPSIKLGRALVSRSFRSSGRTQPAAAYASLKHSAASALVSDSSKRAAQASFQNSAPV